MARTDLNRSNGWIVEQSGSEVLTKIYAESAVEQVARKVQMTSDALRVPTFAHTGVDIVAEGAQIPQQSAVLDSVLLEANKWADRFTLSVEDERDAVVDAFAAYKRSWASSFAKELDNACLGVTADATGPGTSVPFQSVYNAATSAGNVTATAGALKFEMLNDLFAAVEEGDYNGNLVIIAHPSFAGALRNLKDADGLRVVTEQLGGGQQSIFGRNVVYSTGARTSATATEAPTGSPLLIVANADNLILGVRDGVESAISDFRWDYDEREVKMRARRAFAVGDAEAVHVIEKTA